MHIVSIEGRTGLLKSGSRVATRFSKWEALPLGDGRCRVTVIAHDPDSYWWDNVNPQRLRVDLDFGRGIRGPATLVSRAPLILEFTPEEDD